MRVSELGEFGLIDLLRGVIERSRKSLAQRVREHPAPQAIKTLQNIIIDVGDDAAAWIANGSVQLSTTDTLVQNVHFSFDGATWKELGWKALAINISDIAAMGGIPTYALVTLGLPGDTPVEGISELYDGMIEIGDKYGAAIVGGDIIGAPVVVISLTLMGLGLGEARELLTRSSARPGYQVAVTGHLGSSAGGLRMLLDRMELDPETARHLREAHLRPMPRVAEGQALVRGGVRTAMDISDGLVADLSKLCKASGVAAKVYVDRVPVHPALRWAFPKDYLPLALGGGEDYELLFCAPGEIMERAKESLETPVTVIGEIVEGSPGDVALLDEAGRTVELKTWGWDHLR